MLLNATVAALVWANLWTASYNDLWHTPIGGRVGPWTVERPLHFWVNDGLMTVFFLVVGLEIRREIFEGEVANLRKAALPLAAAVGGMLVPAIIFAMLNAGRDGAAGWAIPMATDIAFAVGILTLLGSHVPPALRVLLLALAVIDDIGAIVVIAFFYSAGIAPGGIVLVGIGVAMVLIFRAAGVRSPLLYVAPGLAIWIGLLVTGIHPTIGGVMLLRLRGQAPSSRLRWPSSARSSSRSSAANPARTIRSSSTWTKTSSAKTPPTRCAPPASRPR